MKRIFLFLIALLFAQPFYALAEQGRRVELYCHRTANQDVPENTLESLEQAALLGCDLVEIDLRRTLDGKIVLNHDGFLERLTDGHGEIETSFYDELRMRDAGSWMSDRFRGMRIVLFEDALRYARAQKLRLFLDMKDKGMGTDVLELLRRENMLERVEFGGEWDDVKELSPQANHVEQPAQWVSPGVTAEQVQEFHRGGKKVIVNFSANKHDLDLEGMKAAVAVGADAINVDFPRLGADAVGRPVEARIAELVHEADSGKSETRVRAILELSRYQGFPLQEYFVRWLMNEDEHVSHAASLALVKSRPAPQPAVFAAALRASHPGTRMNAARALGAINAPAASVVLLLEDHDPKVLSEALTALAHMPGNVSYQSLLHLLSHPDSSVRGAAAVALAAHQPAIAAKAIPKQIRSEADAENAIQKKHASNSGGPFSQTEIDQLVAEFRCQMQMLRALHMLDLPSATHELEAEAFAVGGVFPEPNGAVAELMLWDRLGAEPAIAVKALASKDVQAADRAEWALIKTGPAVLPEVRNALRSSNRDVRKRAIRILAWQGDTASLGQLRSIQVMHGQDADLAAWAITKINSLHSASLVM